MRLIKIVYQGESADRGLAKKKSNDDPQKNNSTEKESEKYPRKTIHCNSGSSPDDRWRNFAKLLTLPEVAACRIVGLMQPKSFSDQIDNPTLIETLRDQTVGFQGGDLAHTESRLLNQASFLQAVFVRLTERAMVQSKMTNLRDL